MTPMHPDDIEVLRTHSLPKIKRMIFWQNVYNGILKAAVIFGLGALAAYIIHLGGSHV